MPGIDMPLEKLKKYSGKNPKPTNFDQFWENSINELRSVSPEVFIERANFKTSFANCYDLWFTGINGARIRAKLLVPKNIKDKCPAVLNFHGYNSSSADWYDKLGFVAQGFVVAAMDCRGQGGLSEDVSVVKGTTCRGHIIRGLGDKPENMYYRQVFLDTVKLASVIMNMDEVEDKHLCAMGTSQGGGLALACGALEPKIKKIAVANPFLCDYIRNWDLDMGTRAYLELHDYFRHRDPLHSTEDAVFTQLGYIDVQHLAPRICGDVLMAISLCDNVCSPSSQFAAYNKIRANKNVLLYQDYSHEILLEFSDRVFNFFTNN